ncbi:transmembrane emp24 domain-containing protein 6-like [Ptychodera flava]|uniref:transmembrane emp24 domain-containing protein 6-like n=1 Tax=Ptychodera flava TaxID=63121 RepID=UPI00396A7C1F
MASWSWVTYALCLIVAFLCVPTNSDEKGDPFFDLSEGRPYKTYEFTVIVNARRQECFHQYVRADSKFNVDFEVLESAAKSYTIDISVRSSEGQMLYSKPGQDEGAFNTFIQKEGVYTICLDNMSSRFTAKKVYLEISVFQRSEWKRYVQEKARQDKDIETADNVTEAMLEKLDYISENLDDALTKQTFSRRIAIRDWYLSQSNNMYVQRWSIAQCVVIITASFCQVYFLRRMFNVRNVTPTQKPRA